MTEYTFRSKKAITRKEVHCLWNTLTNKQYNNQNPDLKIRVEGRLVKITCPGIELDVTSQKEWGFETNAFTFVRAQEIPSIHFQTGDFVLLAGTFSYSVHERKTGKDRCPVDVHGVVRSQYKDTFLRYLQERTGVDVQDAYARDHVEFGWSDDPMQNSEHDKIVLNDMISMRLRGRVVNPSALSCLQHNALGRRKSYGCGALHIEKVGVLDEQEAL